MNWLAYWSYLRARLRYVKSYRAAHNLQLPLGHELVEHYLEQAWRWPLEEPRYAWRRFRILWNPQGNDALERERRVARRGWWLSTAAGLLGWVPLALLLFALKLLG